MPSRDRVPMFNPCYRITVEAGRVDVIPQAPATKPIAVTARADSLLIQLARAKRFAAAIRHDVARDKFADMVADLQRELGSIRPR